MPWDYQVEEVDAKLAEIEDVAKRCGDIQHGQLKGLRRRLEMEGFKEASMQFKRLVLLEKRANGHNLKETPQPNLQATPSLTYIGKAGKLPLQLKYIGDGSAPAISLRVPFEHMLDLTWKFDDLGRMQELYCKVRDVTVQSRFRNRRGEPNFSLITVGRYRSEGNTSTADFRLGDFPPRQVFTNCFWRALDFDQQTLITRLAEKGTFKMGKLKIYLNLGDISDPDFKLYENQHPLRELLDQFELRQIIEIAAERKPKVTYHDNDPSQWQISYEN